MSFFSSIGGFFSKLFSKAPSWSQTASATLTLIAPLTNTIVALTAGETDAAEISSIISEVQSDLAATAALISQAHSGADVSSQLNSTLSAVSNNLDVLLKAGHIKNATTQAKVEAAIKTITGEIQAIIAVLPASQ